MSDEYHFMCGSVRVTTGKPSKSLFQSTIVQLSPFETSLMTYANKEIAVMSIVQKMTILHALTSSCVRISVAAPNEHADASDKRHENQ